MNSPNRSVGSDATAAELGNDTYSLMRLAIGALLLLVVVAIIAMLVVSRELQAARDWHNASELTRERLERIRDVLAASRDAETGERGYVITGNEVFLAPYHTAVKSLEDNLPRLQALFTDEEGRRLLLNVIEASDAQRAFIAQVLQARRVSEQEAEALVSQQIGKRHMDRIRSGVELIVAREESMLRERLKAFAARSARTERIVQIGLLAALGLVIISGGLLMRNSYRRMRAERSERAAYETLNATINRVSQGIAVFNEAGGLIVCNAKYLELRGVQERYATLAEFVENGLALNSVDTEQSRRISELDYLSQEFDIEVRREDGVAMMMRGAKMPNGGYVITLLDVSASKRSELAYRDQAVRLTSILDNVVDAIITINESGSIESWSKGAERLFGYQAHEVLRRNVKILMPDPHQSGHDGYLRRYMQTGERRIIGTRREVEALTKDGQLVPVDLGISEMRLGERRLFIGVVRDISTRLEVERLKAGFVSTVSHELRTPLTSIAGSLGLLAGGVAGSLPPKATRLIDIAKLNCERLVLLINDILDLERAESGKLDMRLEPQALLPIVQHAIDLNRSYAHNFGVSIELDAPADDGNVLVDRDRLIQVMTNLFSNAAKFSPRGGTVHVKLVRGADNLSVRVRDEGPGISPEFRQRIFQRFAQADSSDSRAKGGTGLGLSIAKAVIEKLGGTIGFDSVLGQGAEFHISLPLRQEAHIFETPSASSRAEAMVLIIEDDPDIAELFKDTLAADGIDAVCVPTVAAARKALANTRFDVALIDLHLPDANGLQFITELRGDESTSRLPIVVTTASGKTQSSKEEVSVLQLADWLQKPIDPRRLLEAIHNVLERTRVLRARILHVEDDESLTLMVRELLQEECDITAVHSLADAKGAVMTHEYDLIILDIGLGDGSGLDVLPLLRAKGRTPPPVILYSATEASREVSEQVEAALVKSRHSVDQLLASVRSLASKA
jgi:PAS domain S-box-containing protein